jgi:hypothetical protein
VRFKLEPSRIRPPVVAPLRGEPQLDLDVAGLLDLLKIDPRSEDRRTLGAIRQGYLLGLREEIPSDVRTGAPQPGVERPFIIPLSPGQDLSWLIARTPAFPASVRTLYRVVEVSSRATTTE